MWIKSHTIVTKSATREQMWHLFADVNDWHRWDDGIEYARIEGEFKAGNHFLLKPKGSPEVKIHLVETQENQKFVDETRFPLATMNGTHTFETTSEGLRITTTMSMKGPLGFLWRKLVAQGIVDGLPGEMEKQVAYASKL